jgi:hypothetical protein
VRYWPNDFRCRIGLLRAGIAQGVPAVEQASDVGFLCQSPSEQSPAFTHAGESPAVTDFIRTPACRYVDLTLVSRPSDKFRFEPSRKFLLTAVRLKDGTNRDEPAGTGLSGLVERAKDGSITQREAAAKMGVRDRWVRILLVGWSGRAIWW